MKQARLVENSSWMAGRAAPPSAPDASTAGRPVRYAPPLAVTGLRRGPASGRATHSVLAVRAHARTLYSAAGMMARSSSGCSPGGRVERGRRLGEDLVAYRSLSGRVGLLGAFRAYRRASMHFAR